MSGVRTCDWLDALGDAAEAGKLRPGAHAAATVLAAHYCERSGLCWPGYDRIAARSSQSRRGAINAVAALEAAELVAVTRSPGRPNVYRLTIPAPAGAALEAPAGAELEPAEPVHVVHPPTPEPVHVVPRGGAPRAPEPSQEQPLLKTRARNSRPPDARRPPRPLELEGRPPPPPVYRLARLAELEPPRLEGPNTITAAELEAWLNRRDRALAGVG